MEKLPNKVLENAIRIHNATIKAFENFKDADYCSSLDKVIVQLLEELKEYRSLEEQGLLLKLPVPIGTTVYKFEPLVEVTKEYIKTTVTRYEVFDDSVWFCFSNGLGRSIADFGVYVFFTQEEAEQALNRLDGES